MDNERRIFSKNLSHYMDKNGKTQADIVTDLGINKSTVSTWVNGSRMPRMGTIQTLADYFGIMKSDLIEEGGMDSAVKTSNIPGTLQIEKKRIPLLGDIACGEPIFANQEYESYVEVGTDVKADFAVRATGTSMLPKIHEGDIVFVREQPIVEENEVAVVIIDDEVTLKRYRRVNEELVSLIPDNPEHSAIYVNLKEKQNVRILGKAIALQRDIL